MECLSVLPPSLLGEPRIYLSLAQRTRCQENERLRHLVPFLPCWARARTIADALGHGQAGIDNALRSLGGEGYVWATELENVHSYWRFDEPNLTIDGVGYSCSEIYYQSQKPNPFDHDRWELVKEQVMKKALRAKFLASEEARNVLLQTSPHKLLSIKPDKIWGFDPRFGGRNLLAKILEELRDEMLSHPQPPVDAMQPAGTFPRGFRFAVSKAADEQAPRGVDKQIFDAAQEGNPEALLGLCQEWACHPVIDAYKNAAGWNALMIAADSGHEACVRMLIAANADLAYVSIYGRTALHLAVFKDHASICRVLADECADLLLVKSSGKIPLEEAKKWGKSECEAILEAPTAKLLSSSAAAAEEAYAFVNEHIATTRGFRFAATKAPHEQAPSGLDKQIYDAAQNGNLAALLRLCQEWTGHRVIDAYEEDGMNALVWAAYNGSEECVRVLIAANANLAYGNECSTALHASVLLGRASICRVLVYEGASLTAVDRFGQTPLQTAKKFGKAECVAILEAAVAAAAMRK